MKYQVLPSRGCLGLVTHWPVWFADANKRKSTIIAPFIGLALVWKGSEKSNKYCSLRTRRKSEIINLKFSFLPPATTVTRDYAKLLKVYQLFKSVLSALLWFFAEKSTTRPLFQKQSFDWRMTQLSSFNDVCSLYDINSVSRSRMFCARSDKSVTSQRNRRAPTELRKRNEKQNLKSS